MRISSYFQLGNEKHTFSFFQDSAITLSTKIVTIFITLGSNVVISRSLGPTDKGIFDLLILTMIFASLLVQFGLDTANVYFGSKGANELAILVGNSIMAAVMLGAIIIVVFEAVLYLPIFQNYLFNNRIEVTWMRWVPIIIPVVLLNTYVKEIIRAAGHIAHYNAVSIVQAVALLAMTTLFILLLNWGTIGSLIGWMLAQLIAAIYSMWLALRITNWKLQFNYANLIRNLRYGLRLYPGEIAQFLNYRVDVFLVAFFLTPANVGLYTVATSLAERLWEIPHAIRIVLLQRISKTIDKANADTTTIGITQLVAVTIAIGCISLAVLAYPIVDLLFGQAYRASVPAIIALMPGVWALSIAKLLTAHLSARGYPEVGTYGAIAALCATIVLDILLIPQMGIEGAAIASSIAYTLSTIAICAFFLQITGLGFSNFYKTNKTK